VVSGAVHSTSRSITGSPGRAVVLSDRLHRTLCHEMMNGRRKMLVEWRPHRQDPYRSRLDERLSRRIGRHALCSSSIVTRSLSRPRTPSPSICRICLAIGSAHGTPVPGREEDYDRHLADSCERYAKYSAGYFDLIVIDECHRSIYGQWRRALDHFDGIKIGLTATPCVMQEARDVDEEDVSRSATRSLFRG